MPGTTANAGIVEHICLAGDEFSIDRNVRGPRIGPSFRVVSRFRRSASELAVLEGHRLAVRTTQSRGRERQYVVDLRFLDEHPLIRRDFALRYWLVALGCAGAVAAVQAIATLPGLQSLGPYALPVEIAFSILAITIGTLAARRMHETTRLQSVNGRVVLVEVLGNLGSSRAFASFGEEIRRRIADARAEAAQSGQQFLRDELREHRRLYEDGVLSRETYEASKQRILKAHD